VQRTVFFFILPLLDEAIKLFVKETAPRLMWQVYGCEKNTVKGVCIKEAAAVAKSVNIKRLFLNMKCQRQQTTTTTPCIRKHTPWAVIQGAKRLCVPCVWVWKPGKITADAASFRDCSWQKQLMNILRVFSVGILRMAACVLFYLFSIWSFLSEHFIDHLYCMPRAKFLCIVCASRLLSGTAVVKKRFD
jgi:hypothetical protein